VSDSPASPNAPTKCDRTPPLDLAECPTRVRYGVLAFLAAMTFILYLDRACINQAAPRIKEELGISGTQLGFVFGAFTLAYAIFEIPAGWWGDRYGSRRILTRIVVWWSFFTALTGAAWGFGTLILIRFLFGAGEAGALPNSARVLRGWFPDSSRGRAQGFVTTAMMIGGAAAPMASQWLIDRVYWRWSFVVFALAGVVWALAFFTWFRDDPAEHPATNAAERRLIIAGRIPHGPANAPLGARAADGTPDKGEAHGPVPWDRVIPCANVWLLGAVMMTMSAMYEVLSSWYPTYLQDARAASQILSSRLASLVLGAGAFGTLFGGWLTDWLVQRTGNRRWGRTAQAVIGAGLSGLGILASIWTDSTVAASAFVALAAFGVQLQLPSWWASATQVSGHHLGALFGMMNMIGGVGRILSQLFMGGFADWRKSLGHSGRAQWDPGLYPYVAVAVAGMLCWSLINPEKTVEGEQRPQ
jgi:MFS transporter, ACS family, glucarate transporter